MGILPLQLFLEFGQLDGQTVASDESANTKILLKYAVLGVAILFVVDMILAFAISWEISVLRQNDLETWPNWAFLTSLARVGWWAGLVTMCYWTLVRLFIVNHTGMAFSWGGILWMILVFVVRSVKLLPLRRFYDGVQHASLDTQDRFAVLQHHWLKSERARAREGMVRKCACCICIALILGWLVVAMIAWYIDQHETDGLGQPPPDGFGLDNYNTSLNTLENVRSAMSGRRLSTTVTGWPNGAYFWYCNQNLCGKCFLARHHATHKAMQALIAGTSVMGSAIAAGAGIGTSVGPEGTLAGAAAGALWGAVAGLIGGGSTAALTYAVNTEDDECIKAHGDTEAVPEVILEKLWCAKGC